MVACVSGLLLWNDFHTQCRTDPSSGAILARMKCLLKLYICVILCVCVLAC